jgi:hypothetical protein
VAELEETISDAIVSTLVTDVPELTTVTFDRVKLAVDDFRDHELPAVQLWDLNQSIEHQRGFQQVSWGIALELIMKSTTTGTVNQKSLWALRRKIELALWDTPNLEIPGVIHLLYRSNITDLHLLEPFYVARMEFEVLFRRKLTGSC